MNTQTGTHAIIIGGSISGLAAARTLSDHFDRVTVIERDQFPDDAQPRGGVPQSRQPHVMLVKGQETLEQLFPGLKAELVQDGGVEMRWGETSKVKTFHGWGGHYYTGLVTISCTRPFLELHIRNRVQRLPNVVFMTGYNVVSLAANADKSKVTGVQVEARRTGDAQTVSADLVVDASGRNTKAVEWLTALGYDAPEEEFLSAKWGYATRMYEVPPNFNEDWVTFSLQLKKEPGVPFYGGGIFQVEGNRWLVILSGSGENYPTSNPDEFDEFARRVPVPEFYATFKDAKPLTPVYGFRALDNRRRHFEKLKRRPEHFIVTGDAACTFNPIYGQGMTVGALDAVAMSDLLKGYADKRQLTGFAERFYKAQAKIVQVPWGFATGADKSHIDPEKRGVQRLFNDYFTILLGMTGSSPVVGTAFMKVINLMSPPTALFAPGIVGRVLRYWLARRGKRRVPLPQVASPAQS